MTRIKVTTEIDLTIDAAAEWFAALDDDQQAKFFVAVAEKAKGWPRPADFQWSAVGAHLRTCKCSTEEARNLIQCIAEGMENPAHV